MISKIIKYFISGWLEKNSNAEKRTGGLRTFNFAVRLPSPTEKCSLQVLPVVIMEKRRFVMEFDVVKVMSKRYSNDRVVDVEISILFRPIPHTWRQQQVTKKKTQPNQIIKSQDKSFFPE